MKLEWCGYRGFDCRHGGEPHSFLPIPIFEQDTVADFTDSIYKLFEDAHKGHWADERYLGHPVFLIDGHPMNGDAGSKKGVFLNGYVLICYFFFSAHFSFFTLNAFYASSNFYFPFEFLSFCRLLFYTGKPKPAPYSVKGEREDKMNKFHLEEYGDDQKFILTEATTEFELRLKKIDRNGKIKW